MEKFLQIPTKDNHIIYGTLNSYENKKDKLIIFVHGLSGNQHEHQYFNAVPFFCSKGFDTFRFDFYPNEDNSRQSSESSILTHSYDLNTVVEYFKDKYKKLYLIGHSLGCLAIINANLESIYKIIYWDPNYGFESLEKKNITYDKNMNKYILHWGYESIVSKELIKQWKESYNVKEYSKRLSGDCSFVFAENEDKYDTWKEYIKKYKYAIIDGASHRFIEEGTLNKLFEETLKLLEE
jgi:hypothetical protein